MLPITTLSTEAARETLKLKTRGARGVAVSQMNTAGSTGTSLTEETEGLARPPGGLSFLPFFLNLIDIQLMKF